MNQRHFIAHGEHIDAGGRTLHTHTTFHKGVDVHIFVLKSGQLGSEYVDLVQTCLRPVSFCCLLQSSFIGIPKPQELEERFMAHQATSASLYLSPMYLYSFPFFLTHANINISSLDRLAGFLNRIPGIAPNQESKTRLYCINSGSLLRLQTRNVHMLKLKSFSANRR